MVDLRRIGLRHRVALSFLATSSVVALLAVTTSTALAANQYVGTADQIAQDAATAIAQGGSQQLPSAPPPQHGLQLPTTDPGMFQLIDQVPLALPHVFGQTNGPASAEMMVDTGGKVLDSSYPSRLRPGATLTTLVPQAGAMLPRVLHGFAADGQTTIDGGRIAWSLQPVLSPTDPTATGAVYVQIDEPGTSPGAMAWSYLLSLLAAMVVLTPVGVVFGVLTMRSTVGRIGVLVEASQALAGGQFSRRVEPSGRDELTTLQHQFNATAACLEHAVATLQDLAADHARLAERERIARDFHDSVSQELFSLRMAMGALEMEGAADESLRTRLGDVGRGLTGVMREMRAVLLELRPPDTSGMDLPAALEELAASYRSRTELDVDVHVEPVDVPGPAREALLRVAQEALANAARHSGADHVEVRLRPCAAGVELHVADNGRGFLPASAEARRGLGLRCIDEHAAGLGGTLRVESSPGAGTLVVVTAPP